MDEKEIRIGDAEREDAVKRLGEHYEAGRLTAEEHSERVDQALQARTATDLNALFADLPGPHQAGPRTGTQQPRSSGFAGPPWTQPGWQPPWAGGRPPRGGRMPRVWGVPVLLLVLAGIAVIVGIACAVAGGHPPFFLLVLAGIATFIAVRRRPWNNPA